MEVTVTDITTQVEVDAGYELFEVIVTQTDGGEEYAKQAEEAANSAELSATLATSQADIATLKASEASTSASNALASENEAESAATTATQQAILSEAAKDASIVAQLASENSAESASTSASNALASENAAELAASQIVDKIDFTGASEGDLLERNSAGVFVPKSLKAINQSKVPFEKSPINLSLISSWDNFNRPNGPIGTLDSGNVWTTFGNGSLEIRSNSARKIGGVNNTPQLGYLSDFQNSNSKEIEIVSSCLTADLQGSLFIKDTDNYIYAGFIQSHVQIKIKIAGVSSIFYSSALPISARYRDIKVKSIFTLYRNSNNATDLIANIQIPSLSINQMINMSAYYNTFDTFAPGIVCESIFGGSVYGFLHKDLSA